MFYIMTHTTHFIYGYMALDYGKGPLILSLKYSQYNCWCMILWSVRLCPSTLTLAV